MKKYWINRFYTNMKGISKLLFIITTLVHVFFLPWQIDAQPQYDLMKDTCSELKEADKKLNAVYKTILNQYKEKESFLTKIKIAQRAWIQFRDAYIESIFPAENKNFEYGSVFNMCHCSELALLTHQRTKQLEEWTIGIEEGFVCIGSRKIK